MKRKRNNDMIIGTWNVLCLNQAGSLKNLKDEVKHKTALQEIRWQGHGITDTRDFTFLYSDNRNNTLGTKFLVNGNYNHSLIKTLNLLMTKYVC